MRDGLIVLVVSMAVAIAVLVIGRLRHPHTNGDYREIEDRFDGR